MRPAVSKLKLPPALLQRCIRAVDGATITGQVATNLCSPSSATLYELADFIRTANIMRETGNLTDFRAWKDGLGLLFGRRGVLSALRRRGLSRSRRATGPSVN